MADMLSAGGDDLHVWWLGQSGFLLKQNDAWLLLDPYLSDSLTAKYAATDKPHVRMTERCIPPERLGFVKVVTSSHQHTDHFDEATLLPLARASNGVRLILPTAVEIDARRRLGADARVEYVPLDDAREMELEGWRVTGIAAAHNLVERDELGRCKFLGFIIRRHGFVIYHSGDTLLHPGLQPVLAEARCDLMLLPINGNRPERRVAGNMNGSEAAGLAFACGAHLVVPHHFEMFEFNTEPPDLFVSECQRLGQRHRVLRCGERLSMPRRDVDERARIK